MTRNAASISPENNPVSSARRKHEMHANNPTDETEIAQKKHDALSFDSKCATAGLQGSSHENNSSCLDCGRILSNLNEEQDIFSIYDGASPSCASCLQQRFTTLLGLNYEPGASGDVMDISSSDVDREFSQSPRLLRHGEIDALFESLSSDQARSWMSSFGSIETVPESRDFSFHMTDGGGTKFPPPSRPSPPPRSSLPPPKYPEYSSLQNRIDSFIGWPQRVVGVSPASLAACGFFYIGSADRVRCFQCGVTLRNWEPEDDPATEHLTWSPACPVALLPPGPASQTGFRDVQAPPQSVGESNAVGGAGSSGIESASRNFEQLGVNVAGSDLHTPSLPPHGNHVTSSQINRTSDSRTNGIIGTTRSNANAVSSPAATAPTAAGQEPPFVLAVLELGCTPDMVDRVRERKRRLQGTDFPDAVSLYIAVMEEERQSQEPSASAQPNPVSHNATAEGNESAASIPDDAVFVTLPPVVNGNESAQSGTENMASPAPLPSPSPSSGATQVNGRRHGFRQCQLCPQGEVTVTFLPCGHLIACSDCAQKCQACPRCGKSILGTVRTYFA